MGIRANALADRIEQGARNLASFAEGMSDAEWRTAVRPDGRTAGVIVHHVASMYPVEVDLARTLASGKPVAGLTWGNVAEINAKHAREHAAAAKREAIELLLKNARAAAERVRAFTDAELDTAAPCSLNADAPVTAQFFVEGHALGHSWHHLAKIRSELKR